MNSETEHIDQPDLAQVKRMSMQIPRAIAAARTRLTAMLKGPDAAYCLFTASPIEDIVEALCNALGHSGSVGRDEWIIATPAAFAVIRKTSQFCGCEPVNCCAGLVYVGRFCTTTDVYVAPVNTPFFSSFAPEAYNAIFSCGVGSSLSVVRSSSGAHRREDGALGEQSAGMTLVRWKFSSFMQGGGEATWSAPLPSMKSPCA